MNRTILVTAVLAGLSCSAQADEIHLLKGNPKTGVRVSDETYEEIQYSLAGVRGTQSIKADQVKQVIYASSSDKWDLAMDSLAGGDYGKAVLLFESAAANPPKRGQWEKQYGLFQAAECYRAQRMFDKALKAYERVLKEVPKTRFFGDCFQKKAQIYLAQGDKTKAKSAYQELRSEVESKGLSPRWDMLAEFHLVQLGEAGDLEGSLKLYQDLQRRAKDYPDVANEARLRIGYVLKDQGKIADARTFFKDIIDDRQASSTAVVAGAYRGLGNTYVNQQSATAADFEKALFHFLRVVYHYGDQLGGSDAVAESLYWSGRCLEMREKDQKENQELAKSLYRRCIKEFPSSDWAKRSNER
jgi:tetratricopeptide (TPR) repeat protein